MHDVEESTFLNPKKAIEAAGVSEGARVADFGAGSGFFTRAAARAVGQNGIVWAVDVNPELLPRIKNLALAEGLANVEVMRGDTSRHGGSNLPENHFDFVICANLLFQTDDKKSLAEEIHRVLKDGGKALVIDWQGSYGGLGPHPDHLISQASARDLLESFGFSFAQNIPAGEYHWGLLMKKHAI